jgi:hypothetical protein
VAGVGYPVMGAADRDLAIPGAHRQPVALGGDDSGRQAEHAGAYVARPLLRITWS